MGLGKNMIPYFPDLPETLGSITVLPKDSW